MVYQRVKYFGKNRRGYVYEQESVPGDDGKHHTHHVKYIGALETGAAVEHKEHPELPKKTAEQIAKDHLAANPHAYDKEMKQEVIVKHRAAKNQDDLQEQYFEGRKDGRKSSTAIHGEEIYSYGTAIGVKKGNTFYLNDNKYSTTTSKMQHRLEAKAKQHGYEVVKVKPTQQGRTDNSWTKYPLQTADDKKLESMSQKEFDGGKGVAYSLAEHRKEAVRVQKEKDKRPKFHRVMDEYGRGELKKSSGEKVTERKQALAIAYSEQRAADKETRRLRTFAKAKQERLDNPNRKSISEIRAESKDYFWTPDTMRFYRQAHAKYTARYDPVSKTNYVRVNYTLPESKTRQVAYYRVQDGKHNLVDAKDVPEKAR